MNRIILLFLMLSLSTVKMFAQCAETSEPRVLLVGDSWAWFMLNESTINYALTQWGHSNYTFVSNSTLSVNGAQTGDVQKASCEAEILNQLNANPTIDIVHLSIGGNDFLGNWNVNMTPQQVDTLTGQVMVRLDSIIRFIQSCKPGIKIFWSGYCYTNFKQIITDASSPTTHPYYNKWQSMGFPNFAQINTMQNNVSAVVDSYCHAHPNVYYFNANALMQYVYGQPTAMDVAPMGTYAAGTQPMPLGDPTYPSPAAAMRNLIIATDCFHLSTDGFRQLISYHARKFYQKYFMDDLYLLSDSNQTGTVSSKGNVSTSLAMGEAGGENFSSVLSFNTSSMANYSVSKASIFIRRNSLTGSNPISGNLEVKVKAGNFGTTINVDTADYSASGDASGTPCLFGANSNDGDWARLDLPASVLPYIKPNTTVQFIISAPGVTGAKANFSNASDPELAPVLNLVYGSPLGINHVSSADGFNVYPNPTNGLLTIESAGETITHLELTNILGATVLVPQMHQNTLDISSLPAGAYILNITTKNGRSSQRVVKD